MPCIFRAHISQLLALGCLTASKEKSSLYKTGAFLRLRTLLWRRRCVSAVNTRSYVCTLFQNCAGDFRRMAPAGMAISVSSPTARPTFVPPLDTPSTKPLAARRFGPKEAARTATGAGSCMTSMLPSPRCPAPWRLSLAPRRCRCSITATCRCPSHRTCTLASNPSSTPLADLAAVPLSRRIVLSRCLPATTQTADRPGQIKATAAAAAPVVARELM